MNVEVLNTGTELLLGSVINTHLKFLAEALFPLGLRISRQVTVPDGAAIGQALRETFGRANVVLVTGGLGPTTDDLTREAAAELLGLPLEEDPAVLGAIAERFARRSLPMSPRVRLQALRPPCATVLWNDHGTAPGLYLPAMPALGSPHLFLLPGPPRELRPMFEAHALPLLRTLAPPSSSEMRVYRLAGMGESEVEARVGERLLALGLELGYCARPGEVDLRLIGPSPVLAAAECLVLEHLGPNLVSTDNRLLEKVLVDELTSRGQTIATAESCTGGLLSHRLTNVPGASAVFTAGFVTYANQAKTSSLGVQPQLLSSHGAVSAEVAAAMAEGALQRAATSYALATTGIAGPGGATPGKPVGTVLIALARKDQPTLVERHQFLTDRENFKTLATQAALNLLRRNLCGS